MSSGDQSGLPDMRYAPFNEYEVKKMIRYQAGDFAHPYTCCNHVTMEMTKDGLVCPKCRAVQKWIGEATFRIAEMDLKSNHWWI